jgi:hypothetical protein
MHKFLLLPLNMISFVLKLSVGTHRYETMDGDGLSSSFCRPSIHLSIQARENNNDLDPAASRGDLAHVASSRLSVFFNTNK